MTRQELYELIWNEPITHAAKRFGISDVALRKTCVKHNIPTPPVGYWAKLAHGKTVPRPPLPPSPKDEGDRIGLEPRSPSQVPEQLSEALASARQEVATNTVRIVVPKEKPENLHPAAKELAIILRKTREDDIGLLHWNSESSYHPFTYSVSVSRLQVDRAVILLDALFKVLVTCGHTVTLDAGIKISVNGEPFNLSLRETKEQVPHKPTADDLRRQAEYDINAKRYPTFYKPGKKVWRTWDPVPSGRLSLELKDAVWPRWGSKDLVGRWYDRKTKALEEYLSETMPVLMEASILAKHRRAEERERERLKAEREEMQRREKARAERRQKRRDYLKKKADAYEMHARLESLWKHLQPQIAETPGSPAARIVRTLGGLVDASRLQFATSAIETEVREQGLFAEDDTEDAA